MSDSDDTPQPTKRRVQPRPRRVARTTSGGNTSTISPSEVGGGGHNRRSSGSGHGSASSSLEHPPNRVSGEDDDDFFMKTKNYRELKKSQANIEVPTEKDLEASPPSTEQPEAEDSDVIPIFDFEDEAKQDSESKSQAEQQSTTTKRKRELSLTPPPELPKHTFDIIQAMSKKGDMFEPIVLDDDQVTKRRAITEVVDLDDNDQSDDTGLDPELASIAAKVSSASSAGSGAATTATNDKIHQLHHSSTDEEQLPQTPPREVNVLLRHIRYQWEFTHLHPSELARMTMDVKIAMNDTDPFKSMMQFYAMHKMMRPSDLVFTYKNTRLLPSATPRSLLMPPVVVLDIYTDAGYKFMKMQAVHEHDKLIAQNSQPETSTQPSNLTDAKSPQGVTGHDVGTFTKDGEDQEKHDESEFLFIKIRGKNTTDERMRVKKSTTIAAISNHYKKLKKIPENSFVKLEFDDETLDPSSTIAHTDIEDDDMLTATIVS